MTSLGAVAVGIAEQSTQAAAAVAETALAQIQAQRAGAVAQAAQPQAANPPGVGGLVDQTA